MELIAELDPPRDKRLLLELASDISRYYDWIDIPDAPLGKPNYNSPVVAAYLRARGFRVIAHLRVTDVNTIAIKTITKTIGSLGVERIVYLRGDPPQQGSTVEDMSPEEAVYYARTRPEAPEPGLLLSLRKPWAEIAKRLQVPAGFYLALNYDWRRRSNANLLSMTVDRAHEMGKRVYLYLVAGRDDCSEISSLVVGLEGLIDGIIVSSPMDRECLVGLGRTLREVLA
ncbi:MAG: methylenetetrahydrofolate reductase [Desulfurococcales archaeon]|nr:methylenetetrahydrofolate reductase [Desulfurococcales archaeon]